MKRRMKKALKFAIMTSIGITIGRLLIRYVTFRDLQEKFGPPFIWTQELLYIAVGMVAGFLTALLIDWFVEWLNAK